MNEVYLVLIDEAYRVLGSEASSLERNERNRATAVASLAFSDNALRTGGLPRLADPHRGVDRAF
jgi:hypothetical protein